MFGIQLNQNQLPILFIDGKPLHSVRDPYRDVKLFDEDLEPYNNFIFVGVGLGYVLSVFNKRVAKNNVIILFFQFPEEAGYFQEYKETLGLDKLNITVFLFSQEQDWKECLQHLNLQKTKIWIHPYYLQIMQQKTDIAISCQNLQQHIKRLLMNQITDAAFGFRWWRNFLRNYAFQEVRGFQIQKQSTKPLLLIGSGYSTYQSIHFIKEHRAGFLILAVPPVLDLLLAHNIHPDIVVMTDGGSANRYYTKIKELEQKTILLCYPHVYPAILEWFSGAIYMVNSGLEQEALLTPELEYIPSAGSVASTMFEIASKISQKLFTVGFDFAYTQLHPHYPGSPLENRKHFLSHRFHSSESTFAMQVYQGIFFQDQYTTPVLKAYGEYFAEQIQSKQKKGYNIYSAHQFKGQSEFLSKVELKSEDVIFGTEVISSDLKKQRIEQLKQKIQEAISTENYENPVLTTILARARLKNWNLKETLKKELTFLNELLCTNLKY